MDMIKQESKRSLSKKQIFTVVTHTPEKIIKDHVAGR